MRLINVNTRLLEEFIGTDVPRYAILSHTWEKEEVSYDRYLRGDYEHMQGYHKIDMTCQKAKEHGLSFAWVDTCCIDKSSSAELSEAINSMFRWYERAYVCYVYLSDLHPGSDWAESLAGCRWFTRGWTLQELIAPHYVLFYDSAWSTTSDDEQCGRRQLAEVVSGITGIDQDLLSGERHLGLGDQSYCVAQKMSWAARRFTTRPEDQAYSLLGLFGVSMPLLYGEGDRAFVRLQEEIMRSTADLSILAWRRSAPLPTTVHPDRHTHSVTGVLARSAADFSYCGAHTNTAEIGFREFSISNTGIKVRTRIYLELTERVLLLPLQCTGASGQELAIHLLHLGRQRYLRVDPTRLHPCQPQSLNTDPSMDRYLLTRVPGAFDQYHEWPPLSSILAYSRIRMLQILPLLKDPEVLNPWPLNYYDRATQVFFIHRDLAQDMCSADIQVDLGHQIGMQLKLIACGWSDTAMDCQFGILACPLNAPAMKNIFDQAHKWHYGARAVCGLLNINRIPRAMSIHRHLCASDRIAVVSIHPKRHAPEEFIRHHYYTVTISIDTFEAKDVPPVVELAWEPEKMPSSQYA